MATILRSHEITEENFKHLSPDEAEQLYNGLDTCVTLEIFNKLQEYLDPVSEKTYNFSLALQAPILEMTMRGVLIDLEYREEVLAKYEKDIAHVERQLKQIVREAFGLPDFNFSSPHQTKTLFYNILNLSPIRKRNTHGVLVPTTNRDALEQLSVHYFAEPLCLRILALRDLEKKCQFLRTSLDPDNRVRTNFNIGGTDTGRLASSISDYGTGGNVQNIDRDLRRAFIADPGYKFANIDLEQADARNVGAKLWTLFRASHGESFAGAYLDACESGDLHTTVCKMAYPNLPWTGDPKKDKDLADGTKAYRNYSYRDLSKKLGHGSNYVGRPRTMAKHAKIPMVQAETFQKSYFKGFAAIPLWHQWVAKQLVTEHQITTLFGRRRFFFDHPTDDATIRAAVAYEPQSMTADEIDTGLLQLWRANICQLLIQVHDSILIQYPEELEDEIVPQAVKLLGAPLILPGDRHFEVPRDVKVGWNWGDVVYDKDRNVIDNPNGLVKYKGHDSRKKINTSFFR